MEKFIGVAGNRPEMPDDFPVTIKENAGNMIHARAPREMFGARAIYRQSDEWRKMGYETFAQFVNERCSHLVLTFANTLRDGTHGGDYSRTHRQTRESFTQYKVPLVVFGFGVQSHKRFVRTMSFDPETIAMVRELASRTAAFGVRGPTTAKALRVHAGISNTFVTGCPSMFSRPAGLAALERAWQARRDGAMVYAGTNFMRPAERDLLASAIRNDLELIEPVNARGYALHTGAMAELPDFLRPLAGRGGLSAERIRDYFRRRLHLFRDADDWYRFNEQSVRSTFGTRFHVNMASVLSGKPALWLVHDARTAELTDFFDLPALRLSAAARMTPEEIEGRIDFGRFFAGIDRHFDRFNDYLGLHGLPRIATLRDYRPGPAAAATPPTKQGLAGLWEAMRSRRPAQRP